MAPGKYVATLAAGVAAVFTLAASLALLLDPFGVFTRERSAGDEKLRPSRNDNDRLIKLYDPLARPAALIFAGTSRTKQGIDPAAIESLAGAAVYNAGIDASELAESLRQARFHARHVAGLRRIYVELFPLGQRLSGRGAFEAYTAVQHASNLVLLTLSGSAQWAAAQTVLANRAVRSGAAVAPFTRLSGFYPASYPCAGCRLDAFVDQAHWRGAAMDFDIGPDLSGALRKIRDDAAARGVEIRYYLPPLHAWVAYSYFARGTWEALEKLKLELAGLGGVRDFLRFNEIADEPPAPQMKYWLETWHYGPELGRLMAAAMLGRGPAVPANFGPSLDPATIASELAAWRAERDAWSARNPGVVERYSRRE